MRCRDNHPSNPAAFPVARAYALPRGERLLPLRCERASLRHAAADQHGRPRKEERHS